MRYMRYTCCSVYMRCVVVLVLYPASPSPLRSSDVPSASGWSEMSLCWAWLLSRLGLHKKQKLTVLHCYVFVKLFN